MHTRNGHNETARYLEQDDAKSFFFLSFRDDVLFNRESCLDKWDNWSYSLFYLVMKCCHPNTYDIERKRRRERRGGRERESEQRERESRTEREWERESTMKNGFSSLGIFFHSYFGIKSYHHKLFQSYFHSRNRKWGTTIHVNTLHVNN